MNELFLASEMCLGVEFEELDERPRAALLRADDDDVGQAPRPVGLHVPVADEVKVLLVLRNVLRRLVDLVVLLVFDASTSSPFVGNASKHHQMQNCLVIYFLITDSVIKNYVALPNSDLLGTPLGHPRRHVPLHRPRRLRLARVDGEHGGGEEDRKMAQYEPHLDLPSFPSRPPSRNKCAVSPPTRLFTLTSSPQFERKGKWTDGRVGENPKIAPNRSEEGERTPRCSLAAAEAKQHLDIIRVSPLNVNPAGEIMLGDGRSH